MAEWNLRYEKDIKIPDKEKNYFLKTMTDFLCLTKIEEANLNQITQQLKLRRYYE